MTAPIGKTVIVLGGFTGPTGTFKQVNILSSFTGPTGTFPIWNQATGPTGPNGTFESVINVGPTGIKGEVKTVIIPGFSAGGATTTFNPADKGTTTTLSNGNLTMSVLSSANSGARGTTSKSSGKWYFEFSAINTNSDGYTVLGLANASMNLNSNDLTNCVGVRNFGGMLPSGSLGSAPDGHVVGVAVDLTAKLLWVRYDTGLWNATAGASPGGTGGIDISSVSGPFFPVANMQFGSGAVTCTINCGQNAFVNGPPAGFTQWG
jgi:hypothetical protein